MNSVRNAVGPMYLFQENLRYDKMAEGLGARGEYVSAPQDLRPALKRAYDAASKEKFRR